MATIGGRRFALLAFVALLSCVWNLPGCAEVGKLKERRDAQRVMSDFTAFQNEMVDSMNSAISRRNDEVERINGQTGFVSSLTAPGEILSARISYYTDVAKIFRVFFSNLASIDLNGAPDDLARAFKTVKSHVDYMSETATNATSGDSNLLKSTVALGKFALTWDELIDEFNSKRGRLIEVAEPYGYYVEWKE